MAVLDKVYKKYGNDLKLEVITKKDTKVVYHLKSKQGDFILFVIPDITPSKFQKYMRSQGVQQRLVKDGFNAAPIEMVYYQDKTIIAVHRKLAGSKNYERNAHTMLITGKLIGKLHRMTTGKEYKKDAPFMPHPNILARLVLALRDTFIKRIPAYFTYFKFRDFPQGICHRDLIIGNVLIDDEDNACLIDYDKHRYMPFVVGIVYFYHKHLKNKKLIKDFLKGYQQELPLTPKEIAYLKENIGEDYL